MLDGDRFKSYVKDNTGKLVGMGVGLLFGVLVLTLGFWRSILLVLFISAGCWLGSGIDKKGGIGSIFNKKHRDFDGY
ncbi:MAG: DUF2273 domain-containing protein [Clostridiales bacterium]|nr:DUF2273 domain-containing protein [Clostridiales bacterium]